MKRIRVFHAILVFFVLSGCCIPGRPAPVTPLAGPQTIKIASFNIQMLNQSKLRDAEVMRTLAAIVRQFDLVAIQEVRSSSDSILPDFLSFINDDKHKYDYLISGRLGRSSSKEQYAFVYNVRTISVIPGNTYVVDDPDDVFERELFVAYFRSGRFDFKAVNVHLKPEYVSRELSGLSNAIDFLYGSYPERDILVLGDMNADGAYFNENGLGVVLPEWIQLIGNTEDTTVAVSNNTYDRIMARDTTVNSEYTGIAGVYRWDAEFGVTDRDFVKKVSDHYPVFAVFRADLPDDD